MIKVEGQIALQISIGDQSDFLDAEDFISLDIYENAGGLRPVMELSFVLKRESIIPYLNSGNIVSIMYGITEPRSTVYQFEIMGDNKTKAYALGSTVSLHCAWYNPSFTNVQKSFHYGNKYSYEVVKQIADNNNIKLITNISKSNDKCEWHQNGVTDWTYLNEVCTKAYINDDTFISYAIDNDYMYFYDIRQLVKDKEKWLLSVIDPTSVNGHVINIGTYKVDGSYQGNNAIMAGKNVQTIGYDLDKGEYTNAEYSLKSFLTLETSKINVNATGCKTYNYEVTTDEEHPNMIAAKNNNLRNNVLFSSYCCYVPTSHQLINFRLLDLVQLKPAETDNDAYGYYFITAIAKSFRRNMYRCNLTLNRESANGIKSESLEQGKN